MFKKKYIAMILLLVALICMASVVSAANDTSTAGETSDILSADDASADEIADFEEKTDKSNDVLNSEDELALSKNQSENVLSTESPSYDQYSIKFTNDTFQIRGKDGGNIRFNMTVYEKKNYYRYNFYMEVYHAEDMNNPIIKDQFYSTTSQTDEYDYPFNKNEIKPGLYIIAARNVYDNVIMDSAILRVSGTGAIAVNNYDSIINSGAKMTANVTDNDTGLPLKYIDIEVVFTSDKKSVTKTYKTDANGLISFVPPVGAGTWSAKFSSRYSWIPSDAVTKTVTIKKLASKIIAKKKTFKKSKKVKKYTITLKTGNKPIQNAKVSLKIKKKTYKAKTNKKGKATFKIKKLKKGKYTAKVTFKGNKYYKKSTKKVKIRIK